jgi:pimeloyl-ACP methyl ester carboxylesterase
MMNGVGAMPNQRRAAIIRPRRLLLAIVIAYFVLMFFGHLPDRLILFPTKAPIDTGEAVRKTIPFQNGALEVWTAQSRRARETGHADVFILRFYGNADRADRWPAEEAEMWSDRAVEIWGMNYPGFGGSTGPARLSRIGQAALAGFDELKRHAGNRPIIPYGTSIGATAALHVAASRPAGIAGVLLHNPVPLREIILRRFGWWNLWLLAGPIALQLPPDLDSVTNAKNIHAPAIFLVAEKDEVVPSRYHKLVADAYAGEKRVIKLHGAYHNDPIEGAALADLNDALGWLLTKTSSH